MIHRFHLPFGRKLLSMVVSVCLLAGLCLTAASCSQSGTPSDSSAPQSQFHLEVVDQDGNAVSGVLLYIYAGSGTDDMIAFGKTGADGKTVFTLTAGENYTAVVKELPAGFTAEESYSITASKNRIALTGSAELTVTEPSGETNPTESTQPDVTDPSLPPETDPTQPSETEPETPTNPTSPVTPTTPTETQPTEPGSSPIHDNKDNPNIYYRGTMQFEATVKANHIVYYGVYGVNQTILEIHSSSAYVIMDDKTYYPKNGVVSVAMPTEMYTHSPVLFSIGNSGGSDATFSVTFHYPEGHYGNPYTLRLGTYHVHQNSGNEQGVYLTYTATASGTLTPTFQSVTPENCVCGISLQNTTDLHAPQKELSDSTDNSVSITVAAGDVIRIRVNAGEPGTYNYPEADITIKAAFE